MKKTNYIINAALMLFTAILVVGISAYAATTISTSITTGGTLDVTGASTLSGGLTVTGTSTISGGVSVGGGYGSGLSGLFFFDTGRVQVNGDVNVNGNATTTASNGNFATQGTLTVAGATTVTGLSTLTGGYVSVASSTVSSTLHVLTSVGVATSTPAESLGVAGNGYFGSTGTTSVAIWSGTSLKGGCLQMKAPSDGLNYAVYVSGAGTVVATLGNCE